jgi:hypothetical protein
MNNFFHRNGSDTQQPSGFLVIPQIVKDILKWLASLIKPMDEDQEKAGVYLGGEGRD